jgi:hypothetical protein
MLVFLPGQLKIALAELDQWLEKNEKNLEIVLIGATAVSAYTNENRFTQDIDTVKSIDDEEIIEEIRQLAKKHGLALEWLSDSASTVTLPEGFLNERKNISLGSPFKSKFHLAKISFAFVQQHFSPPINKPPWSDHFKEALGVLHDLGK